VRVNRGIKPRLFVARRYSGDQSHVSTHIGGSDIAGGGAVGTAVTGWREAIINPAVWCGVCECVLRARKVWPVARSRSFGEHITGGAAEYIAVSSDHLFSHSDDYPFGASRCPYPWRLAAPGDRARALGGSILIFRRGWWCRGCGHSDRESRRCYRVCCIPRCAKRQQSQELARMLFWTAARIFGRAIGDR